MLAMERTYECNNGRKILCLTDWIYAQMDA